MNDMRQERLDDRAPGDKEAFDVAANVRSYVIGLVLAALLTMASFWALDTKLIWGPGIGMALAALAVAQMGVHLVFFLQLTTDPDNTNNALALAFGVLIVTLVVAGTLWIMANLNHHYMPMDESVERQVVQGPDAVGIVLESPVMFSAMKNPPAACRRC